MPCEGVGDEEPEAKQQRVAGQEREEQPALDEDDGEADPDERGAEPVEQVGGSIQSIPRMSACRCSAPACSPRNRTCRCVRQPTVPCTSTSCLLSPAWRRTSGRRTTRCRTGRPRSGVGPWEGPWPEGEQYDATLLAEGDRRNVVDRYRYWTHGGDRRRPGRPAARLPRRDRELAARLQHRDDRPHRERVPRPRGAHRRQPAVEPAGCDGHRPLPARRPPRDRRRPRGAPPRPAGRAGGAVGASTTCPARCTSRRPRCRAGCCFLLRPGGPRPVARRPARRATRRSRSRSSARRGRSTPCGRGIAMHARCTPWVASAGSERRGPSSSGEPLNRRFGAGPGTRRRWGSQRSHGTGGSAEQPGCCDRPPRVTEKYATRDYADSWTPQGQLRLPGHQRVVLADAERRAPGVRRRRLRRHRPGLHRWRGVPVRAHRQEHGDRLGRVRGVRPRGGQELLRQHRAAHRPLPQGQARRLRPAAARPLRRAGGARRAAAVPVAHVGRLGGPARREPPDRRGAARDLPQGQHHPRDRGRCRRRRGGRRRRVRSTTSSTPRPRTPSPPSRRSAPARTAAT